MAWAMFKVRDDEGELIEVHVAPADANLLLSHEHILSGSCSCQPKLDPKPDPELYPNAVPLYIHNHLQ